MGNNIREILEEQEEQVLHPRATRSRASKGRQRPEPECDIRPAFQHDRDRILHSKAFRRLKHKTQVFLAPAGDHYRTRLTHTLEVSQIGRTLARALRLNESLVEAVALAHDLGHTPFGHAGEAVLHRLKPGGFHHSAQSLRVVDLLERDGQGLNLTAEVREGIPFHTKGKGEILRPAATLEAQAVRLADLVAYLNHDVDDALRAGVIRRDEIPRDIRERLGESHGQRIDTMVRDAIGETLRRDLAAVALSNEVHAASVALRQFLYERVYENPRVHDDFVKASKILEELYRRFLQEPAWFLETLAQRIPGESVEALAADFVAGMTDRYALALYEKVFMPQPWKVL
ncbi:MAG: deoxyguanosinetriphosphate triphosphohydrolase [Thermodesulfobacteriota bacterium]|jgi:dGTPase